MPLAETAFTSEGSISEGGTVTESHVPGELGVWIFIFGDMIIFSLFFMVFLYYRNLDTQTFLNSQKLLSQNFGAVNTIFLLTSSWFVVLAVQAVRRNSGRIAGRLFLLAFLCGIGFAIVKFLEYGEKIRGGYTLITNDFFMYYYIFTGIHFIHVILGMAVLVFLYRKSRSVQFSATDIQMFESGGAYWHMVDLLWIVLFPLLYLVK